MLGTKAQGIADRQRIRSKLRLVIGVTLHPSVRAESPSAAQLEQTIIALRLEAALLKQDPDEGNLIGGEP
jgi:hypothetical protein